MEKMGNKSTCSPLMPTPLTSSSHADRFFRRPSSISYKQSHPENHKDLIYLPVAADVSKLCFIN